ncbi:MAG: tRNA ((37)-N6)-threonylcarbamoyltransferase complex transferase subunit TsaD [Pseudomonadota bacterium]
MRVLVLGIETSCDETGVALYDTERGLLGHVLHSQVALHAEYGGVVPELASRDHIRRLLPLIEELMGRAGCALSDLDAIAYTAGPGLSGALLVGASVAESLAMGLEILAVPVHHLEGHLLSPLLSARPPVFPFVALLVSGGHTQLMSVRGVGDYTLLGETVDDAAGEAFDKTAKLLGLGYPGGSILAALAERGQAGRFALPRPMLHSGDFNFSFSGLKTAVLTAVSSPGFGPADHADLAADFECAAVDVLVAKSLAALSHTGLHQLVVAGGVGANKRLRHELNTRCAKKRYEVFYPEFEFCTDNGAMIAFAGAARLLEGKAHSTSGRFAVRPRWDLQQIETAN